MVVRGLKVVFVAKYLYLSVVPALYESSFYLFCRLNSVMLHPYITMSKYVVKEAASWDNINFHM